MAGMMTVCRKKKTEIVWDLWDEFCQKTSITYTWECAISLPSKKYLVGQGG